jgi:hypothetical protein
MKTLKLSVLAITALFISSCSSDDDAPILINEDEVITTVMAEFTPQGGGTAVTLTSRDLDGDGPDAPVVTVSGPFMAGTVYNGAVTFLNELASPAEDITEEVEEEGTEHQVFIQQTGLGTITYTDQDADGNPIGLAFTFEAAAQPATGIMTITLRHEPNKIAEGVANGDISNAGGSTDAEVTFATEVVLP